MAFAFPAFCFALISGGRFKSFDDGFGLRRSGGLGFPSPVPSSGWLKRNDNRRRSYYLTIWTDNLQLLRHLVRFRTPAFTTHVGMPLVKTSKRRRARLTLR
jgi:hypothetical protein